MNMKRILMIALICIAVVASVSSASAGWLDGFFGQDQEDNIVEIDSITFNTTNLTGFELNGETDDEDGYYRWFADENKTGYNVHIYNYSYADDVTWNSIAQSYKTFQIGNSSPQTVDGIEVYTLNSTYRNSAGEPGYVAYVQNDDLHVIVDFLSKDPAETAKMASTLKFE
jgi:hypothetical protein